MLTKVEIRPVVGSAVELNTTDGSGNPLYPLNDFSIVTNIDTHDAKKMAAAGQWRTFHYPDAMVVVAEGHIVGVGANDTARAANYFAQRLALLDAALPPVTVLTSRIHGVLRVRFDGMTEDADADVVLTSVSAPLAAMFPANSEFQITWKAFEPYFTGTSSATKYQLG
jgi:hypothetical protein